MKFDVCIKGDYCRSDADEVIRSDIKTKQLPSVGEFICIESSDGGTFNNFLVMEVFRAFYEDSEVNTIYVLPM